MVGRVGSKPKVRSSIPIPQRPKIYVRPKRCEKKEMTIAFVTILHILRADLELD